ncbi:hypothetical protein BJP65_15555 [Microbacterium sp. BH-3-3-3]|nr:hypothetical protein BJP65_15555 [Microbacterium sp. BH-3-3-3]
MLVVVAGHGVEACEARGAPGGDDGADGGARTVEHERQMHDVVAHVHRRAAGIDTVRREHDDPRPPRDGLGHAPRPGDQARAGRERREHRLHRPCGQVVAGLEHERRVTPSAAQRR